MTDRGISRREFMLAGAAGAVTLGLVGLPPTAEEAEPSDAD